MFSENEYVYSPSWQKQHSKRRKKEHTNTKIIFKFLLTRKSPKTFTNLKRRNFQHMYSVK